MRRGNDESVFYKSALYQGTYQGTSLLAPQPAINRTNRYPRSGFSTGDSENLNPQALYRSPTGISDLDG
jgi:hypothetical protein